MTINSVGDMARISLLRQHTGTAKNELDRLTNELATGQATDPGKALRGAYGGLATIERSLRLSEAFRSATAEAALHAATMQTTLEGVSGQLSDLVPVLLGAAGAGTLSDLTAAAANADDRLDQVTSALNTRVAGRSLFAADATNSPAVIAGKEILSLLEPVVAGAVTGQDMLDALESWFMDPGGGFETQAYLGGTGPVPDFTVGAGDTVAPDVSALSPALRKSMMGLALAALVADGHAPPDPDTRRDLLQKAGTILISGQDAVTILQAGLGQAESRIEAASVRNEATYGAMSLERGRLLSVDPYETVTQIEALQTRIESLYLLTARLSRLSLAEFLR